MQARDLDELLGTNGRLAIMATLAQETSLPFSQLGRETGLADGNLHVQTQRLLAAGYLERHSDKKGRRKITRFSLTPLGKEKYGEHVALLATALGWGLKEPSAGGGGRRGSSGKYSGSGRRKDDSQVW